MTEALKAAPVGLPPNHYIDLAGSLAGALARKRQTISAQNNVTRSARPGGDNVDALLAVHFASALVAAPLAGPG